MGNGVSPPRVALEFGWDTLPPLRRCPGAAAGAGRAGQRRAERGSEHPGGAAARRERGAAWRDGQRAERAARGMERLPPSFPGRGASPEISAEREKTVGEGVRVWMRVDAVQPEMEIIPPASRLPPPLRGSQGRSAPLSGVPGGSGGVRGLRASAGAAGAPRRGCGGTQMVKDTEGRDPVAGT